MSSCAKPVRVIPAHLTDSKSSNVDKEILRRACGCVRTSEKLRKLLTMFPQAPPPTPSKDLVHINYMQYCDSEGISGRLCHNHKVFSEQVPTFFIHDLAEIKKPSSFKVQEKRSKEELKQERLSKSWVIITELVSLLQLSVTATALVIYYIIFCYMQLIYYVLRSVVYFHHADLPMKITLSIVTITGLVIGLNILTRMENLVGIHFRSY